VEALGPEYGVVTAMDTRSPSERASRCGRGAGNRLREVPQVPWRRCAHLPRLAVLLNLGFAPGLLRHGYRGSGALAQGHGVPGDRRLLLLGGFRSNNRLRDFVRHRRLYCRQRHPACSTGGGLSQRARCAVCRPPTPRTLVRRQRHLLCRQLQREAMHGVLLPVSRQRADHGAHQAAVLPQLASSCQRASQVAARRGALHTQVGCAPKASHTKPLSPKTWTTTGVGGAQAGAGL
jgi:hypothetical protein